MYIKVGFPTRNKFKTFLTAIYYFERFMF